MSVAPQSPYPVSARPPNWREIEMMRLINILRAEEGDSITLICDNPDFNMGANCAVECHGYWTDWWDVRFEADTLLDALSRAFIAYNNFKATGKAPDEPKRMARIPRPRDEPASDGLAEGCRSASSPCAHQKVSPYTLCEACQPALKAVTIVIPSGYRDAAEFLKDCQFEEAPQPLDPAQSSPRCDRCGSSGDTYVLCSGCGMPASPPYPVQYALKECASRCRYDGDLFHDQGNIARRDASWKAANMAEDALSALDRAKDFPQGVSFPSTEGK